MIGVFCKRIINLKNSKFLASRSNNLFYKINEQFQLFNTLNLVFKSIAVVKYNQCYDRPFNFNYKYCSYQNFERVTDFTSPPKRVEQLLIQCLHTDYYWFNFVKVVQIWMQVDVRKQVLAHLRLNCYTLANKVSSSDCHGCRICPVHPLIRVKSV